jgi:hypothetical protein
MRYLITSAMSTVQENYEGRDLNETNLLLVYLMLIYWKEIPQEQEVLELNNCLLSFHFALSI